MRNNFQSLSLVILILFSLLITKEAKIETLTAKQPASFLESVTVTTLNPSEAAAADIPKVYLPKSTTSVPLLPNFGQQATAADYQSSVFNLGAKAVLVSDLDNDEDFIIHNINQRWSLASITKLMTAVLTLEEIGKEKEVVVSKTAIATEGEAGKLETGRLYKIEDLIKIMLVTSSNDAAVALAEFYAFGQKSFVKMMNKKAVDLGMVQTVFFDPVGLSPLNQSTAGDIRKLIKYIDKIHPEIFAYSRETNFGELKNINPFAGQPNFLGGKTGYLDEAKENLVSLFSVNEQRILVIVLGAENRFNQTREILDYLTQR